ncbi:hypothetical protein PspLS_01798 [Pyricularia sp. CBS 133598]|nr:hypothetical protein PspLS_01798 [Pyricularia sp. CBS 133598]
MWIAVPVTWVPQSLLCILRSAELEVSLDLTSAADRDADEAEPPHAQGPLLHGRARHPWECEAAFLRGPVADAGEEFEMNL